ncbi:hypothetical protein YC2023_050358 [Brassica napus]
MRNNSKMCSLRFHLHEEEFAVNITVAVCLSKKMTTIWDLPEDMLVEEIFSRVPLNYIKSVRSTCKKWNTLLRSRIIGKAEAKKQFTGFMMMNHKVCFIEFHLQNAFIYYCNHPCIKQVSILDQINVSEVIYSDGLLLCITKYELLVWNPYLGQTRWIQPRTKFVGFEKCFLGYDKNLNHKILRFCFLYHQAISSPITGFEIYDFSSDSWNVLDVTPPPDWEITPNSCVSLKGNTYFCARRREVSAAGRIINVEPNFLVCFDFTTESFGPRLPLPFDSGNYAFVSLSCVREEQLAVLYQFRMTHEKIDIFVTNKISPSVVSWIKFIVGITGILLHLGDGSFFIDEETKLAVVFGRDMITRSQTAHTIETSGYSKSVLIGNASAHRPLVCSSYAPSSDERVQCKGSSAVPYLLVTSEENGMYDIFNLPKHHTVRYSSKPIVSLVCNFASCTRSTIYFRLSNFSPSQYQITDDDDKGEIAGDIVGFQGEIAGEKRGVAQRKKREMGKKKGLVIIKPRVRRTLSVGILISIFAKYLPDGPKRNNVIDRLDYPIDRSRISSVPWNVLGKSCKVFYKRIDRWIYVRKRIDRSLRWTKAEQCDRSIRLSHRSIGNLKHSSECPRKIL